MTEEGLITQALSIRDSQVTNLPEMKRQADLRIEIATYWAQKLMDVVESRKMATTIQGKKYLQVEGWQVVGELCGVTPIVEWTRPWLEADKKIGYEARVNIVDREGRIVSSGESSCGFDAFPCRGKQGSEQEKAARSAAQTWAASRAYRNKFGFVAKLAGYEPTPSEEMSLEDNSQWAWLAGIVDGEGSLGIYEEKDPRKGPEYSHPRATLQIVNTHQPTIQRCRDIIGDGDMRQVEDGDANHKPLHRLQVRRQETLERILPHMIPCLITKKAHAELVLEFVKSRLAAEGRGRYAEFTERERAIVSRLKEVNSGKGEQEAAPSETWRKDFREALTKLCGSESRAIDYLGTHGYSSWEEVPTREKALEIHKAKAKEKA